jgi:hypothetical protein
MQMPPEPTLDSRLKAWAQAEIHRVQVPWTPEYLLLKARLTRRDREAQGRARLERGGWLLGAMAGILGLWLAWPAHLQGWSPLLETPLLLLAPLLSLGLLGESLRMLLEC